MIEVKRLGKKHISINGHDLLFDQSVNEYVVEADRVIVLLLVDDFAHGDPMVGRNILAYDSEGALLWRVEDHGLRIAPKNTPQAFFDIGVDGAGLYASAASVNYDLDPKTGKLSNGKYHR